MGDWLGGVEGGREEGKEEGKEERKEEGTGEGGYLAQASIAKGSSATMGRKSPTLSPLLTPMD